MPLPDQALLKTKILLLFRQRALLTAGQAHDILRKRGVPASLQAIYRALKALHAEDIVQKIGFSYALNTTWVLQLQSYANSAARTSFSDEAGLATLAREKKRSWKFESLRDMDAFWGHITLYLLNRMEDKTILAWHPYTWFYLLHKDLEAAFHRAHRLMGGRFFAIVGGDCFLNRWAAPLMERNKVTYSLAPGPFQDRMDSYLNILGDHIITAKLKPATATAMAELFEKTRSFEGIELGPLIDLFATDGHCTLTVEHNPAKAKILRGKFSRYFGETF